MSLTLTIDPDSPDKKAYQRDFESRHEAQVFIDNLFVVKEIGREQWSCLFDELSRYQEGK